MAFFPGLPALLRAGHSLGLGYPLAGLVVSAVALAVAAVALSRLGDLDGPSGAGLLAVVGLVAAPSAVFLAAGYSEAVFLAFAVPAWLAARRGRWWLAGLLGAGASTVRVSGLFLAAGLGGAVPHRRDGWVAAVALGPGAGAARWSRWRPTAGGWPRPRATGWRGGTRSSRAGTAR